MLLWMGIYVEMTLLTHFVVEFNKDIVNLTKGSPSFPIPYATLHMFTFRMLVSIIL